MAKKQHQPKAKRSKGGKVNAWIAHFRCCFVKIDYDGKTYVERCSMKIHGSNLNRIKHEFALSEEVVNWIEQLQLEKGYRRELKHVALSVDKWEPVRGSR